VSQIAKAAAALIGAGLLFGFHSVSAEEQPPAAAASTPAAPVPAGPVILPPAPLEPPGATQTLRLASGAELWTIPYAALQQFVADGTFTDRRLLQLAANSGWPAILRNAQGGTISAMGILRELPTTFVVELGGPATQRCSSLPCENPQQCTSTLSWWAFLPACLQAAAMNPAASATTAP